MFYSIGQIQIKLTFLAESENLCSIEIETKTFCNSKHEQTSANTMKPEAVFSAVCDPSVNEL
jgi:hypothetical protein